MRSVWSIINFFGKKRRAKAARNEDDRELFVERYRAFLDVLRNNNRVLLTIKDMQEKSGGGFVFDRAYLRNAYETVADGVRAIVDGLDVLADGAHPGLADAFRRADAEIRTRLSEHMIIPDTADVLDLGEVDRNSLSAAGGKCANLGEMLGALDFPVPPGFVITAAAYRRFIEHNQIHETITERLSALDIRDYDALEAASAEIQATVRDCAVPPALAEAVRSAFDRLRERTGGESRVAVRSSALQEDVLSSFAGQYRSALNIGAETLLDEYRRVVASLFTSRAIFYFKAKGFAVEQMAMAVGVLAMVDARCAGVVYSRDPERPAEDRLLLNAVKGLGPYAVGGQVPADQYRISGLDGEPEYRLLDGGMQEAMLTLDPAGGTREIPLGGEEREAPCLTDELMYRLAGYARRAEAHFGLPQDMEWAVDGSGEPWLLQSRPLRVSRPSRERPRRAAGDAPVAPPLIERGVVASPGVGAGSVRVIRSEAELGDFPDRAVLVVRNAYPEYAVVLERAAAVVADMGSVLGHLATVAREYRVPALFGAGRATEILADGMTVTVDAVEAAVYEGVRADLLEIHAVESQPMETPVQRRLREVLDLITPLHLTDPRAPDFRPESCATLHDVTRFAHEMALRAMFQLSRESHFAERSARRLVSSVPLNWWVIDLEDGLAPGVTGKNVPVEKVVSIPLRALWDGMTAVPWKGPPPVDTQGFKSRMLSGEDGADEGSDDPFVDKNYMVVARNFCNVSTRLGFHFSTIESYLCEEETLNYIAFVYTGGGADDDRKCRRARLVAMLLERLDFRVEVRADAVFSRIEQHPVAVMAERLKALGHIIVHTRQMDMVMYNDKMVDWYYREFLRQIESVAALD